MPRAKQLSDALVGSKGAIVVIDDDEQFISICSRMLRVGGYHDVQGVCDFESALSLVVEKKPDLVLIDIHLEPGRDGLELLRTLRAEGYKGLAIIVSGDSSKEQCFRAAKAGANDFLLKRPTVNLVKEVERVFRQARKQRGSLEAATLSELGYLRSFGLTPREVSILEEFTRDYCGHWELAHRVKKAPDQVRKSFSRIYKKLEVDNMGQLIHLLTLCSMFDLNGNRFEP